MLIKTLLDPRILPLAIWRNRELLWQWTKRQMAIRYAGSFLGYFWTLATPLLMLAVYTFVFAIVFKARWSMLDPSQETTGGFAVILFCGMAMFTIFSESVLGSARCVIDNPNLVKKVIFPLELLPVAQTLAAAIIGQVWFALTLLGALAIGFRPGACLMLFPLALIPLLLFSLGMAFFVAAGTVYLRDMPHVAALAVQILVFMTPIFYPETMVPASLSFVLDLNPLAWLVSQARDLLLFNRMPSAASLAASWLAGLAFCQLGFVWFMKLRKGFADVL